MAIVYFVKNRSNNSENRLEKFLEKPVKELISLLKGHNVSFLLTANPKEVKITNDKRSDNYGHVVIEIKAEELKKEDLISENIKSDIKLYFQNSGFYIVTDTNSEQFKALAKDCK
jgi:hypothetical protein